MTLADFNYVSAFIALKVHTFTILFIVTTAELVPRGGRKTFVTTEPIPGPSCSKLTMSLVNDSLKFTSSDTQIC